MDCEFFRKLFWGVVWSHETIYAAIGLVLFILWFFLPKYKLEHKVKNKLEKIPLSYRLLMLLGFIFISVILTSYSTYKDQQKQIINLKNALNDANNIKKHNEFMNDLYQQPLATGKANIKITVESKDNFTPWGSKGYIQLAKGQEVLLVMGASQPIRGEQIGNKVCYMATLELEPIDKSIGKPIRYLAKAEYAQINIEQIPPNSKVINGIVIFTFNSSVHIEIPIPPQTMDEDAITIQDIQKYFKE